MALGEVSTPKGTWAVYSAGIHDLSRSENRDAELEAILIMGIKVRYGT